VRARPVLLIALILAGCGAAPKPADAPRLRAALEAESDGARRYARGDYRIATRRFDEAARLFASIDDTAGTARNRLHLARGELALGRPAQALEALTATDADAGLALDALLLRAQAQLDLSRIDDAGPSLAAASARCGDACPRVASLQLLQARAALAGKRAVEALGHATAALKLLQDQDEAAETGNAWRLIATARLATGDAVGALPAARNALDIDRRLAAPEKIARDWLLIGDIHRVIPPGGTHAPGGHEAAAAYRRALDVAHAAGLDAVTMTATQALQDIGMQKKAEK